MSALEHSLEALARVPVLLVAADYDGTLAPIVADPEQATPNREAVVALRALSTLAQTHVAVISGRALRDLARLCGMPEDVHLVGSHGSEFDLDFAHTLPPGAEALRRRLEAELAEIAHGGEGLALEVKPASVAFHYRNARDADADRALQAILHGPATLEGVYTRHGKKVVELAVVPTHKGSALDTIRHRVGASAVVFLGDDVTDEDAFRTLRGPDLGVKVGDGETGATVRVRDPLEVARVLARLAELRAAWLQGSAAVPIEAHAMLSDLRTVALVTPDARVTWYCVPRIDSPALFAELVDGPAAGRFAVRPAASDAGTPVQRYRGDTMVVETAWPDCRVVDCLDVADGRTWQRAGRSDLIRCVTGRGRAIVEFAPRLDFGRVPTRLVARDGGLEVEGAVVPIVLRASPAVPWMLVEEGPHHTARAEVDLDPERPLVLELRYGSGTLRTGGPEVSDRVQRTGEFWSGWADGLRLPSVAAREVLRSALVLKALCFGPTGAISAAGTTSLPEHLGGVRNWDYRYCWLRDAAMAASALVDLGSRDEAMEYLDWVLAVLEGCDAPERLQPLYTVLGRELGPEAEIAELAGYAGSRPVRVGNAASSQIQLDVFGPIVELVHRLVLHHAPLSHEHWRLVETMVQAVERRWREPDHGIWEIRKPRRHHVHSKVMCWVTVDRAIAIAEGHLDRAPTEWTALRAEIAEDVVTNGWKPEVGSFTAAYDGEDLDAAALFVGLTGLLPPGDPRFAATVDAVERHLRDGPTVYRYRADDGLPGFEGGFHICMSWLIDSYLLIGRRDHAARLFGDLVALTGPTGLLSEQYEPHARRGLGNHPQAYSHIGLIGNAIGLAGATG